ncbi:hypothetical protein C8245_11405 [Paracidovorax avenae]|uniref:DUF4747 family protein n=1 Tax=Paracidovorax avenae TaxID=80867 RepID=UPI000D218513|nr:DUF4747 family protein [Paracidovorax avenae]AVS66198.1 hypothetical protein C8245_11405 [Paracidovorax avenae]
MAKFVILNIQLLPKENGIDEVGTIGYKRLFARLRDKNNEKKKSRELAEFHFLLNKDLYFGPNTFSVRGSYFYGVFYKYRTTDKVTLLNNNKEVFKNDRGNTAASHENPMPYVFDAAIHHLCLDSQGLSSDNLVQAFTHLLKDIAKDYFPDHHLKITSLNKKDSFDDVVSRATAYKTVAVSLTFRNGEGETQELLRQLKETKTQSLKINASGGDGKMSAIPPIIKEAADAAFKGTGNVALSYYDENGRLHQYSAKDNPVTFQKNKMSDDDDLTFFRKVHHALLEMVSAISSTKKGGEQ